MKRIVFLLTFVVAITLASCKQNGPNGPEIPTAKDSITVVSFNYFDFPEPTSLEVIDLTEKYATIEVEKSLLEVANVSEIKVANVITVWEKVNAIPFYFRVDEVKDLNSHYQLSGETVDLSVALCGQESYNLTLNTNPYFKKDPTLKEVQQATKAYGPTNAQRTAQLTDESGEIHPAVLYCDPDYLVYINDITKDTVPINTESIIPLEGNPDLVVVDMQSIMPPTNGEWRLSVIFEKDLSFKLPSDEKSQEDGYLEAAVSLRAELGVRTYIDVRWWGRLDEFQAGVFGNYSVKPTLGAKFSVSKKFGDEKYVDLFSFPSFGGSFLAGPVPIYISCEPSLVRKISAEVTGKVGLTLPFAFTGNFEAFARWKRDTGYDPLYVFYHNEEWPNQNNSGFEAAVEAEANVGIYLKTSVLFYKIMGPTVTIGPNLNVKGSASLVNLNHLSVDLETKAQVKAAIGGEIKFLYWTLGSFDYGFTLWEASLFKWSWETNIFTDTNKPNQPLYQIPRVLD